MLTGAGLAILLLASSVINYVISSRTTRAFQHAARDGARNDRFGPAGARPETGRCFFERRAGTSGARKQRHAGVGADTRSGRRRDRALRCRRAAGVYGGLRRIPDSRPSPGFRRSRYRRRQGGRGSVPDSPSVLRFGCVLQNSRAQERCGEHGVRRAGVVCQRGRSGVAGPLDSDPRCHHGLRTARRSGRAGGSVPVASFGPACGTPDRDRPPGAARAASGGQHFTERFRAGCRMAARLQCQRRFLRRLRYPGAHSWTRRGLRGRRCFGQRCSRRDASQPDSRHGARFGLDPFGCRITTPLPNSSTACYASALRRSDSPACSGDTSMPAPDCCTT